MTPTPSGTNSSPATRNWKPIPPAVLQQSLPQFIVEDIIGQGGMAVVYKGLQPALDRTVAIKILSPSLTQNDDHLEFIARFNFEARAMAMLEHPSIVSVYDFGETTDEQLFIVMEYVDGIDIQQYLRNNEGILPQERALNIISQVLSALDYAHGVGIIHRDIKPSNILITQSGSVKIADFGLAKISQLGVGNQDSALAITMTNVALGTPDFIAPETFESGKPLDHRADIYAVGVMLYQMLTGKLPRGHFKSPCTICHHLDRRLDAVICKSLETDPNDRYSSALEMKLAIDLILAPQSRWSRIKSLSYSTVNKKPLVTWLLAVTMILMILALSASQLVSIMFDGASDTSNSPKQSSRSVSEDLPATRVLDISTISKHKPFKNSLGMRFVPVPIDGGPSNGKTILFSIWETRIKDYQTFLNVHLPNRNPNKHHPATMLTWHDAVGFCDWLTARERENGVIANNLNYRLPTDHEWSCAVGIGSLEDAAATPISKNAELAGIYPWGNTFPPPITVGNYLGEEAKPLSNSAVKGEIPIKGYNDGYAGTAPVGHFGMNQFGIYDLGGNVWELCQDWLDPAIMKKRVFRGMSNNEASSYALRSSKRGGITSGYVSPDGGFRVVLAEK